MDVSLGCVLSLFWLLGASPAWALADSDAEETQPSSSATLLQALHCPPCERIHCSPLRTLQLTCKGGVTTGVCGCCPTCARQADESCGGSWDYLGKCDQGLVCVIEGAEHDTARKGGICKSVLDVDTCRPDCTWEFCQANPHEICSGRHVSLGKQDCQGSCQHTSCSSCLVLQPPRCPQSCGTTDPACLQNYGRCVRRHLAHTHHPPTCHQTLQSNFEGYFLCMVPPCLNTVK
ncbi:IGFBP domain-containing protein [Alosa sapidissima]|uniref:IGFBP domain-containing protein n=1 Tax=Alosa sapidissima TaxID=34773 RepID=UPI001C0A4C1B|nr:IGFBP domain-containing protein [Alosa sapidissima]